MVSKDLTTKIWLLAEEQKYYGNLFLCPICDYPLPDSWVKSDLDKCLCCQTVIRKQVEVKKEA